jgi:hypothetical protein
MNDPAVKFYAGLSGIIAIGQAEGTRWVVRESLTHDSINTWTVLTNVLGLAVWEVIVARPA